MKTKFKVGDRVRIKDFDELPKHWNTGMRILMGETGLIEEVVPSGDLRFKVRLPNGLPFWLDDENFELIETESIDHLNTYQQKALEYAIYPQPIVYPALGINGEAGEIAEKVKKVLRDKEGVFGDAERLEIAKEVSDVLWYVAALADDLGYTLAEIAEMNINKLESRKDRGVLGGSGDNR